MTGGRTVLRRNFLTSSVMDNHTNHQFAEGSISGWISMHHFFWEVLSLEINL